MSKQRKNEHTAKIFALVFAIILWSYVMSDVNPKITKEYRNVNVVYSNMDELDRSNIVVMEPKEVTVNVKVSGRRSDILKISDKDISAKLDLSGYPEGSKKVPIYIDAPSKIEIVDYTPKEVLFKFDSIISKEKPVVLKTEGKLKEGYILGTEEIKPQSVFIKGPRSWVNSVSEVVAIVDLTDRKNNINLTVPIKLIDDKGKDIRGLEKDPNVVDILLPVYKTKSVSINADTNVETLDGYETSSLIISPNPIEIKGYENIINGISSIKTEPIDANLLLTNKSVEAKLILPEGVELVNPDEKVIVTLDIDRIVSRTFEYSLDEIGKQGLENGLKLESGSLDQTITISVNGAESKVNNISKEDIHPYINLYDLGEGVHDVKIDTNIINGINILNINPSTLKIALTNH